MTTEVKQRSKKEELRYNALIYFQREGYIEHLHCQPVLKLKDGKKYVPSFRYAVIETNEWVYEEARNEWVYEEARTLTPLLFKKIKLARKQFGITIKTNGK